MQKAIHSPGIVPTFLLGSSSPTSDLSVLDTWRGIPGFVGFPDRYTFIDETAPDDSDYITQGFGNGGSIYACSLGPPPAGANGVTAYFRIRRMGGTGVYSADLTLNRGGTFLQKLVTGPYDPNVPLDFTTFSFSLTAGEIATMYGAAGEMQMSIVSGGGPGTDALECSWEHIDYFP